MTLRLGVLGGRADAILGDIDAPVAVDIAAHTSLPSDPMACIAQWDNLRAAVRALEPTQGRAITINELDCPVPAPRQMFAIGLNYSDHARETGAAIPAEPSCS